MHRRAFLKSTLGVVGATLALPPLRVLGANDDIRVAIIGIGNKGKSHVQTFQKMPGARLVALCDVDPKRLQGQLDKINEKGKGNLPLAVSDPRRVIESKEIDAVVIATPNHWHSLLARWAVRAGKDVYVEKPVSHNIWEGAKLVDEAKAAGRVVQAGTQYRSCKGLCAARAWLQEGQVGKLQWAHVLWYEYREAIGKCAPFTPTDVDYNLWCGPAPLEPLTRPKLHYDWHWVWPTGDGDLGNSGIHAYDSCRWFIGEPGIPRKAMSLGGRFTYDDAAQTPNTQFTLLDFGHSVPVFIENRNLSMEKGEKIMDQVRRTREGFILQYEGGYFAGLRNGGVVYDNNGTRLKEFPGDGGLDHAPNFIQAVRDRRPDALNAPIREGHISSAVCHLGNISYRLGKPGSKQACQEALGNRPQVPEAFGRLVSSLKGIGVDLDKTPFTLGPWLEVEPATGEILGVAGNDKRQLELARKLARGQYREPFSMPTV